ncbi:hypothetical protein MTP10_17105 [Nonomuraea sp. 3-1Str]|uniref:hypothetical protein n=1 Tax=unclassified Nonomuraea TaxID=2593643 RepID=UPI00285E4900|nr:hypothetical protein [Nonomuraea sp. 3-1Str]MDR8410449.1 hypothetical protein [Nonomuraea sp. 3-1Str]
MSIIEKIKDMFGAHGKHHQVPQQGDPMEGLRDRPADATGGTTSGPTGGTTGGPRGTTAGPGQDLGDEDGPAEGTEG